MSLADGDVPGPVPSLPGRDAVGGDVVVALEDDGRVGLADLGQRGRRGRAGLVDGEHTQVVQAAVADDRELAARPAQVDPVQQIDVVLAGVLVGVVDALKRSSACRSPSSLLHRTMHPYGRVVGVRIVRPEERLGLQRRLHLDRLGRNSGSHAGRNEQLNHDYQVPHRLSPLSISQRESTVLRHPAGLRPGERLVSER
jgi:hypothetical protein